MRTLLIAAPLAALTALPAAALTQTQLNDFLAAAAKSQCIINEQTIAQIVVDSGITDQSVLQEAIVYLAQNDGTEVSADQTTMRIVAGPCAG